MPDVPVLAGPANTVFYASLSIKVLAYPADQEDQADQADGRKKERKMVRLPYFADPANLKVEEVERKQEPAVIPDDIPLDELADSVVRGKRTLTPPQMRLLIELLPYYRPKLTAVATTVLDGRSFGELLDKAIERQQRPKLLPKSQPVEPHPASELAGPFARLRRRV
jgi:hypothetical protein